MNKLLKDAIADAKAVRETALANAKVALEEAFAPKLQSMLSHKIKEEMEDDETASHDEMEDEGMNRMMRNAGLSEEEDELEQPHDDNRNWGEKNMAGEPDDVAEEDEDPSDEFSDEMPAEDEYSDEEEPHMDDKDLEELIRELEGEDEEMPAEDNYSDEEENLEEVDDFFFESEDPEKMETEGKKKKMMEADDESKEDEEEVDLEEVIRALREEDEEEEPSKSEEELEEAYKVIKFLRSKLNEVNLLNAKLLYVNKLFKKGQLSETQKVKIIETFDRAKNVREAKLIYTTLAESVNKATATKKITKKPMMEGFASAPQKSTKIISESNGVYNRFKELVNFNK